MIRDWTRVTASRRLVLLSWPHGSLRLQQEQTLVPVFLRASTFHIAHKYSTSFQFRPVPGAGNTNSITPLARIPRARSVIGWVLALCCELMITEARKSHTDDIAGPAVVPGRLYALPQTPNIIEASIARYPLIWDLGNQSLCPCANLQVLRPSSVRL
jgi:hypothetical protein